jgi:hypothetical protein
VKYYFNRKLSDLVWTNYAASFCCLLATYFTFIEYREEKKVFYEGLVTVGIIQKCNCTYSSRIKSSVDLKIKEETKNVSLKVGSDFCFKSVIGDSISVKYLDKNLPILIFNPDLTSFTNKKLYLSIFALILAIFFLLFRYEPEEYIPKRASYKKGEKHIK